MGAVLLHGLLFRHPNYIYIQHPHHNRGSSYFSSIWHMEYHKSDFLLPHVFLNNLLEELLHALASQSRSLMIKAIFALGCLKISLLLGNAPVLDQILLIADEA